jgi:hypothetical protein
MSNHCIDVTCPNCHKEYDAHLHWTSCPYCGYDWMEEGARWIDENPKDIVAALHGNLSLYPQMQLPPLQPEKGQSSNP